MVNTFHVIQRVTLERSELSVRQSEATRAESDERSEEGVSKRVLLSISRQCYFYAKSTPLARSKAELMRGSRASGVVLTQSNFLHRMDSRGRLSLQGKITLGCDVRLFLSAYQSEQAD